MHNETIADRHRSNLLALYQNLLGEELDEATLRTLINKEVEEGLSRASDLVMARAFWEAMGIPGTSPEDFLHRIVSVDGKDSLVAGIRFRQSGTAPVPFIQLSSWSFDLAQRLQDIFQLFRGVSASFSCFNPQGMRCYLPHGAVPHTLECYLEHTLYGKVLKDEEGSNVITLHPVVFSELEETYSFYSRLYRESLERRPYLRSFLRAESKEDFTEMVKDALCFHALYEGESLGLIMGERSDYLTSLGIAVRDIVLSPTHWGQGLGVEVHKAFYYQLEKLGFTFVHGFIDRPNEASRKTAIKVGRKPLLDGYMFSNCPDLRY